jgi:hypothetical protein
LKQQSDYEQPLRRFLKRAAAQGRSWDEVFAEIAHVGRRGGTVKQHLIDHARAIVEERGYVGDDGTAMVRGSYGSRQLLDHEVAVDENTGILLRRR